MAAPAMPPVGPQVAGMRAARTAPFFTSGAHVEDATAPPAVPPSTM